MNIRSIYIVADRCFLEVIAENLAHLKKQLSIFFDMSTSLLCLGDTSGLVIKLIVTEQLFPGSHYSPFSMKLNFNHIEGINAGHPHRTSPISPKCLKNCFTTESLRTFVVADSLNPKSSNRCP